MDGDKELYHYGVLGMKWGRRKAQPTSSLRKKYDEKKQAAKTANKEYGKAFNAWYNRSHQAYSLSKNKRLANQERLATAIEKGAESRRAKTEFKKVRIERKQAIKDAYKKVNNESSLGDKLLYNNATRKKAAKYIVDHNMSMADARKKANNVAKRNTAVLLAGAIGTVTVKSLIDRAANPAYSVLDASGNVIRNFYK